MILRRAARRLISCRPPCPHRAGLSGARMAARRSNLAPCRCERRHSDAPPERAGTLRSVPSGKFETSGDSREG